MAGHGSLIFQDFESPEAMTVGHRGLNNSKTFIFEDFEPPEATTIGHRGFKNTRPSIS